MVGFGDHLCDPHNVTTNCHDDVHRIGLEHDRADNSDEQLSIWLHMAASGCWVFDIFSQERKLFAHDLDDVWIRLETSPSHRPVQEPHPSHLCRNAPQLHPFTYPTGLALLLCSISNSTTALGSALTILGFCHAPVVPAFVSVIAAQVPKNDQPAVMVTSAVFTSTANVAASYGGPHLVVWLGWRGTFRFFAVLSSVGGLAWVVLMRRYNKREQADNISPDKKRRRRFFSCQFPLRCGRPRMMPEWVSLFGHPSVWAIVVAHSAGASLSCVCMCECSGCGLVCVSMPTLAYASA